MEEVRWKAVFPVVHEPKARPFFGSRVSHFVKVRTSASRLKRLFQPLEASRRF